MRPASASAPLLVEWEARGVRQRRALSGPLTVGRAEDCDIVLDSPQVSRRHCVLRPAPGGIDIDASMSTNGVFVNGRQRVQRVVVPAGASFSVGGVMFTAVASPAGARVPGGQSSALPVVFAVGAAAGVLLMAVVLVAVLATRRGSGDATGTQGQALAAALNSRDGHGALVALGAPDAGPADDAAAQALLDGLPAGTTMTMKGSPSTADGDGVRVQTETYTVAVPGQPARTVVLKRLYQKLDGGWQPVSVVLGDES